MFSKYIFPLNWTSLSADYKFDNNLSLNSTYVSIDGNIDITYVPLLSSVKDYSNNNYSIFFVTNEFQLKDKIKKHLPTLKPSIPACVIANGIDSESGLISEGTRFLKLFPTQISFTDVYGIDDNSFFELDFISSNEVFIYTVNNKTKIYLAIDDINTAAFPLTALESDTLPQYLQQKTKLNYIYDSDTRNIVLYKIIQGEINILTLDGFLIKLENKQLDKILDKNIFTVIKTGDLPASNLDINWVSYKNTIDQNNLNIDRNKSKYSIKNNFLLHSEYDTFKNDFETNIITLKNQIDPADNIKNVNDNFRTYESLFTGGNRETGYDNISIGYKTTNYPIKFQADKITWFHMPSLPTLSSIPLNSSNFFINGSKAGRSPIFSDKVWKKSANYESTSNMGINKFKEHTGNWLCAWLSGGNDKGVWMDRYYNPDTFTPFQALTYSSNVDYTIQNSGKYQEGINDVISDMVLEPGSWYAYSRVGKNTIKQILNGISDHLISDKLDSYYNINGSNKLPGKNKDGYDVYEFEENSYGKLNTINIKNYNNFTLSFFGTRSNWNNYSGYQIIGNYLDSGFGLFNNYAFNPLIFYFNKKVLSIFNHLNRLILRIDLSLYIPNEDFEIIGFFRRELGYNFHVITSNYKLLEFTLDGTIVDTVNFSLQTPTRNDGTYYKITSVVNNTKEGLVYFENKKILRFNLFTNDYFEISEDSFTLTYTKENLFFQTVTTPILDSNGKIYIVDGYSPILKGANLYYRSPSKNSITVYKLNETTEVDYISGNENILGFNFNKDEETFVVYKNLVKRYDVYGRYVEDLIFDINLTNYCLLNIYFQDLNSTNNTILHLIDDRYNNYLYNVEHKNLTKIDSSYNANYYLPNLYSIDFVTIFNVGSGYSTPPQVNITSSLPPLREAILVSELDIQNGAVSGIRIIDGGLYKDIPNVFISQTDNIVYFASAGPIEFSTLSGQDIVLKQNLDLANTAFIQSVINLIYPVPTYSFKIKLFNQLDYEDVEVVNNSIFGSALNTGTHHFVITLDTINGEFNLYVDGRLFKRSTFSKNKYAYSSLLTNGLVFGANPFYGEALFEDFYKSSIGNAFCKDLKIENLKLYDTVLTIEEIELLYLEKYPPKDISINIEIGSRNYIDTIARTFRHKLQGSKSNLINLYINDSLITDIGIQKMYENLILTEIYKYLPAGTRINSIKWNDFKQNNESMSQGYFNVRNTITDTI